MSTFIATAGFIHEQVRYAPGDVVPAEAGPFLVGLYLATEEADDSSADDELAALRSRAEELNIPNAARKGAATLTKEIAAVEAAESPEE